MLLKDDRIQLNSRDNDGWTPFMIACSGEDSDIVKLLIKDLRVNLSLKIDRDCGEMKSGSSAVDFARKRRRIEIVEMVEEEKFQRNQGKDYLFFLLFQSY